MTQPIGRQILQTAQDQYLGVDELHPNEVMISYCCNKTEHFTGDASPSIYPQCGGAHSGFGGGNLFSRVQQHTPFVYQFISTTIAIERIFATVLRRIPPRMSDLRQKVSIKTDSRVTS